MNFSLFTNILILFFHQSVCQIYSNDSDIYLDVQGFLSSRGFESSKYSVITDDGYILNIFRIINPYIKPDQLKPKPVLMWHGVFDSAEAFLRNRKGRLNQNGVYSEDNNTVINDCKSNITSTLGFTLSACGYDVWLANTRGNQYSNEHVNLSRLDPKYWKFTLTEIGLYDVPATVQRVLDITKKETLSFIGDSLGTTTWFVLLSLRPDYEKYFRPFIGLAPVAFLGHTKSLFRALAPIEPIVRYFAISIGLPVPVAEFIGAFICGNGVLVYLCVLFNELLYGKDMLNTDLSRVSVYTANSFDPTSSRVLLHFAQSINTGRFAQFNFGAIKNFELYGSVESPSYPLENITSKDIYLFQGLNDKLADPTDGRRLYRSIPGVKQFRINPWPRWTHLDAIEARYANKFQDGSILEILRSYN